MLLCNSRSTFVQLKGERDGRPRNSRSLTKMEERNGGSSERLEWIEQFVLRFALAQSRRRGRRRWNRPRAVESNSTGKGSTDECLNSLGSVQRDGRSAKPAHETIRVDTGAHRKRWRGIDDDHGMGAVRGHQ